MRIASRGRGAIAREVPTRPYLLALRRLMPLLERSCMNTAGNFNLTNVAQVEAMPEAAAAKPAAEAAGTPAPAMEDGEAPTAAEAPSEPPSTAGTPAPALPSGFNEQLYQSFWSLQRVFADPHAVVAAGVDKPDKLMAPLQQLASVLGEFDKSPAQDKEKAGPRTIKRSSHTPTLLTPCSFLPSSFPNPRHGCPSSSSSIRSTRSNT